MKSIFATITDVIFILISSFLLYAFLLNYYFKPPAFIILAVMFSLLTVLFYTKLSFTRRKKKGIALKDKKLYEDTFTKLYFLSDNARKNLFIKAFNLLGRSPVSRGKDIVFLKEKKRVFLFLSLTPVNKTDLLYAYRLTPKDYTAEIYAESFSDEITEYAKNFNGKITLVSGKDIFDILKQADSLPDNPIPFTPTKKEKLTLKNFLYKKHALKFFTFGVCFMFYSFFTGHKIYYVIVSGAFLFFALFIRLFGKEQNT